MNLETEVRPMFPSKFLLELFMDGSGGVCHIDVCQSSTILLERSACTLVASDGCIKEDRRFSRCFVQNSPGTSCPMPLTTFLPLKPERQQAWTLRK